MNSQGVIKRTILLLAFMMAGVLFCGLSAAQVYAATNLEDAQAKYGIDQVVEVSSASELSEALETASDMSQGTERVIVHVPGGTYKGTGQIVPAGVLLVAEPNAVFKPEQNPQYMYIFRVKGSIYGGQYDGESKVTSVLRFDDNSNYSGDDGIIENANVTRGQKECILAMRSGCKNAKIINCETSLSGENGISCMDSAYIALIDKCYSHGNGISSNQGGSGINLSHADVGVISNCTLSENTDKAVSTNSDPVSGYNQPGCTIESIENCVITKNKQNGVYIKPKCTLNSFTGNKLSGNKDGLVASGKTAAGTKGKSVIKNVANNEFKGSQNGQITSGDKGATIYLKNGNKVLNGKADGIFIKNQGVVKITGKNNLISGNKGAGIYADKRGKLVLSGANIRIMKNKSMGIYLRGRSQLQVTGAKTTIANNQKEGIGGKDNCKFVLKGSKLLIKGNGASGIYLDQKCKFTSTGKKAQVVSNKGFGLYAKNKSVATLKNVKFSNNKKKAVYAASGAKIKK